MALARIKTWIPLEVLSAADLNAEFNNILNNPTALISPFTANLNANGKQITSLALENLGASPTAATAGRIWWNTASTVKQIEIDDGSFIRAVPTILSTSLSPGDLIYSVAGSSQGGNPSWTRLPNASSSQAPIPLVAGTSGPIWENRMHTAWITWSGVTTSSQATPLDAFGVSTATNSLVQLSSGVWDITWSVPFANAGYSLSNLTMFMSGVGGPNTISVTSSAGSITSTHVTISVLTPTSLVNPGYLSILAVGRV